MTVGEVYGAQGWGTFRLGEKPQKRLCIYLNSIHIYIIHSRLLLCALFIALNRKHSSRGSRELFPSLMKLFRPQLGVRRGRGREDLAWSCGVHIVGRPTTVVLSPRVLETIKKNTKKKDINKRKTAWKRRNKRNDSVLFVYLFIRIWMCVWAGVSGCASVFLQGWLERGGGGKNRAQ